MLQGLRSRLITGVRLNTLSVWPQPLCSNVPTSRCTDSRSRLVVPGRSATSSSGLVLGAAIRTAQLDRRFRRRGASLRSPTRTAILLRVPPGQAVTPDAAAISAHTVQSRRNHTGRHTWVERGDAARRCAGAVVCAVLRAVTEASEWRRCANRAFLA